MNLYREIYKIFFYIKNNVNINYLIVGIIVLSIFIFINISKILWWSILIILIYLLYLSRKTNLINVDNKLDKLCDENPELEICKTYLESKRNHKKIVETIQSKLSFK